MITTVKKDAPGNSERPRFPGTGRTRNPGSTRPGHGEGAWDKTLAVSWGLLCHGLFACAVASMAVSLYGELTPALGRLPPSTRWFGNTALALQFVAGHSIFLNRPGSGLLTRMAPLGLGRKLATTTFGMIASIQLLAVFVLWSTDDTVLWAADGFLWWALLGAYVGSWLFLIRSLVDAGISLQIGSLGWIAVLRGTEPRYPPLQTQGTFRHCRQPIYLAFALILVTGPVWTIDHLLLAVIWVPYCILGPRLKEERMRRVHGDAFERYKNRTPYWFPRPTGPTRRGSSSPPPEAGSS